MSAPFNIETHIRDSIPNNGYFIDSPVPLTDFRSGVAVLTGVTDPTFLATSDAHVIEWGAADTDAILLNNSLPGQWCKADGRFRLRLGVVLDIAGVSNPDVDLLATMIVKNKDGLWSSAKDPDKITVGSSIMTTPANGARLIEGTDDTDENDVVYEWDLSAYDPFAAMTIKIVPDQAPGTSNKIRLLTAILRPRVHAGLLDRDLRS